ncbi:MAG: glycosyltransferase [Deltaproteobacteria bacterium]|nr:glycosyltransferase [Deltaproteobacteria bacterium]
MKIAIVHEWLVTYAGAERALEQMLQCYPQADLFATVDFLPPAERGFLQGHSVRTTWIQWAPLARRFYRHYLPFMPLAVLQHDLSGYDVVISSNHAVAKGVKTRPDQLHLCYCYTPMRYTGELQELYLRQTGMSRGLKGWVTRRILERLRLWDVRTAKNVTAFMAISNYIAQRIQAVYHRDSVVVYPPVDTERFEYHPQKDDYYILVSRLVPYKLVDLVVAAFTAMPDRRLVVIGDGPEMNRVRAKAGRNVALMGKLDNPALRDLLQRAKAFLIAAEEDFGISPVEAQACGTPVIAFRRGGAVETVRGLEESHPTGVFFAHQTTEAIQAAVAEFEREASRIQPENCRKNALRFSAEHFRREFSNFVEHSWTAFKNREDPPKPSRSGF